MKRFRDVLGLVRDALVVLHLLVKIANAIQVFMSGAINYRCYTNTATR